MTKNGFSLASLSRFVAPNSTLPGVWLHPWFLLTVELVSWHWTCFFDIEPLL